MSFICKGCRDAADASTLLARTLVEMDGRQGSVFDIKLHEPRFRHDRDVCEDADIQPSGCPCQHQPVTLDGKLRRPPQGAAQAV